MNIASFSLSNTMPVAPCLLLERKANCGTISSRCLAAYPPQTKEKSLSPKSEAHQIPHPAAQSRAPARRRPEASRGTRPRPRPISSAVCVSPHRALALSQPALYCSLHDQIYVRVQQQGRRQALAEWLRNECQFCRYRKKFIPITNASSMAEPAH